MKTNNRIALSALALLILSCNALAGETGTHGGNPVSMEQITIGRWITEESGLKKKVDSFLKQLAGAPAIIQDAGARAMIEKLLANGLLKDVEKSKYEPIYSGPCEDWKHAKVSAAARNGAVGGTICFSAPELDRLNATQEQVVALAIHEHAHHLGEKDENFTLTRALTEAAYTLAPAAPHAASISQVVLDIQPGIYKVVSSLRYHHCALRVTRDVSRGRVVISTPPAYTYRLPDGTLESTYLGLGGCVHTSIDANGAKQEGGAVLEIPFILTCSTDTCQGRGDFNQNGKAMNLELTYIDATRFKLEIKSDDGKYSDHRTYELRPELVVDGLSP